MKEIIVTVDASWIVTGECGWAAIINDDVGIRSETGIASGIRNSTDAELVAVIAALKLFNEPAFILVRTDSRSVIQLHGNLAVYKDRNWKRTNRKLIDNWQAIQTFYQLCRKHRVSMQFVKGHHTDLLQIRADRLAFNALKSKFIK